jgi:hypothetical protein
MGNYPEMQCNTVEDSNLQQHCWENFRSHRVFRIHILINQVITMPSLICGYHPPTRLWSVKLYSKFHCHNNFLIIFSCHKRSFYNRYTDQLSSVLIFHAFVALSYKVRTFRQCPWRHLYKNAYFGTKEFPSPACYIRFYFHNTQGFITLYPS